jgi:hypothetical protein
LKEFKFMRGQGNETPAQSDSMLFQIDYQVFMGERLSLFFPSQTPPAENGLDSGHQFPGAEGLHDVVISAKGQTGNAVNLLTPGRQDEDRNIGGLSEPSAHLPSVDPRKHQIENDKRGSSASSQFKGLLAVIGNEGLKPFPFKIEGYEGGGFLVILHNQNLIGHTGHALSACKPNWLMMVTPFIILSRISKQSKGECLDKRGGTSAGGRTKGILP